jgi:NADH-quinone oxidoreductase subunit F
MLEQTKVVMRLDGVPDHHRLDVYEANGGYAALRKAVKEMKPAEVIDEVKASGLLGKGGAGFPAGLKWSFVPKDHPGPKYLACNADEGEPGTFKDRWILEHNPHQMIEGCIIAAYAVGISHIYVYCRGEFYQGKEMIRRAAEEAYAKGYLGQNILGSGFSTELTVHTGAGSYECGEETALLTSLEGGRGHPKMKPPFPASEGAWRKPTVINNVETLATVPEIINRGAAWHAGLGTEKSKGIKMVCISGHVEKPGNYEVELGVPTLAIINDLAGGMKGGRALKGFFPGGSSTPVLPAAKADVGYDYESVAAAGSMLGSGALIVFDDKTDVVRMAEVITRFYTWESCGKCTPCREGTRWMLQIYERILKGGGRLEDVDLLLSICDHLEFKSFCPFGDAAVGVVRSTINLYRDEYEDYIRNHKVYKRKFMPVKH